MMSTGNFILILLIFYLVENIDGLHFRRRSVKAETKYKSHSGRDKPVYVKCRQFLNYRHQSKKENFGRRANQPFGPLCRPNMDKFMECFRENIYNSSHPYDVVVRTNTNFYRVSNSTTELCKHYKEYKPDMSRCLRTASRCISRPRMSRHMVDSQFLCTRGKVRCDYESFSKCDIKGAMMASRYFYETNSNGCILTDPLFQLFPRYGPELGCYSHIDMHGLQYMNLAQAYDHFCRKFELNRVLSCIIEKFPNITSQELLEDQAKYVTRAKNFAHERHRMCKALLSPDNYDCMRDGESVDIKPCQEDMFLSALDNDHATLEEAIEKYSECIFDKYNKCNPSLAVVIRDNIKSYN